MIMVKKTEKYFRSIIKYFFRFADWLWRSWMLLFWSLCKQSVLFNSSWSKGFHPDKQEWFIFWWFLWQVQVHDRERVTTKICSEGSLWYKVCYIHWGHNNNLNSYRKTSIVRGRILTPSGQGLRGVRVSNGLAIKEGFTLTRSDGYFDFLLTGGGAVQLKLGKSPFLPQTRSLFVPVNQVFIDYENSFLITQLFADCSDRWHIPETWEGKRW